MYKSGGFAAGIEDVLGIQPIDKDSKRLGIDGQCHLLTNNSLEVAIKSYGEKLGVIAGQPFVNSDRYLLTGGAFGSNCSTGDFAFGIELLLYCGEDRGGGLGLAVNS